MRQGIRALRPCGRPLPAAVAAAKACLRKENKHAETLMALERAEELAAANVPHEEGIAPSGKVGLLRKT